MRMGSFSEQNWKNDLKLSFLFQADFFLARAMSRAPLRQYRRREPVGESEGGNVIFKCRIREYCNGTLNGFSPQPTIKLLFWVKPDEYSNQKRCTIHPCTSLRGLAGKLRWAQHDFPHPLLSDNQLLSLSLTHTA